MSDGDGQPNAERVEGKGHNRHDGDGQADRDQDGARGRRHTEVSSYVSRILAQIVQMIAATARIISIHALSLVLAILGVRVLTDRGDLGGRLGAWVFVTYASYSAFATHGQAHAWYSVPCASQLPVT